MPFNCKRIALTTALLTGLFTLTHAQAESAKALTVGAIYLDTQGYYAGVKAGVQQSANASGDKVNLIETNAQGDISKESTFIDTLIARKVDAIVLSAVSEQGSRRAIQRASEAGIPVVCYNTCISDKGVQKYVAAYLVGDPVAFGRKAGDAAADYFIANKITAPKIAVINCEAFEVCVQRRKGFEAALKQRVPGMSIVANQEGTAIDKAISVGEKLLISQPDLDAIFGESGGASLGAVKAVRNQNRVGKTVVFGSDMTTEIAQELNKNQVLKAVVDISGKKMGEQVFAKTLQAINKTLPADKVIQVPIDLYTTSAQGQGWLDTHQDGLP